MENIKTSVGIKILHGTDGKWHLFDGDHDAAIDIAPFDSKEHAEAEAEYWVTYFRAYKKDSSGADRIVDREAYAKLPDLSRAVLKFRASLEGK